MHVLELCANPRQELDRHYVYLELPYDEGHDVNIVGQITVEDDEVYGGFGDHTIRRQAQPQPSWALV